MIAWFWGQSAGADCVRPLRRSTPSQRSMPGTRPMPRSASRLKPCAAEVRNSHPCGSEFPLSGGKWRVRGRLSHLAYTIRSTGPGQQQCSIGPLQYSHAPEGCIRSAGSGVGGKPGHLPPGYCRTAGMGHGPARRGNDLHRLPTAKSAEHVLRDSRRRKAAVLYRGAWLARDRVVERTGCAAGLRPTHRALRRRLPGLLRFSLARRAHAATAER